MSDGRMPAEDPHPDDQSSTSADHCCDSPPLTSMRRSRWPTWPSPIGSAPRSFDRMCRLATVDNRIRRAGTVPGAAGQALSLRPTSQ